MAASWSMGLVQHTSTGCQLCNQQDAPRGLSTAPDYCCSCFLQGKLLLRLACTKLLAGRSVKFDRCPQCQHACRRFHNLKANSPDTA